MGSHVIHTFDDRFHIRMRRHVAEQVVLLRCGEESAARQMQVAFGELVLYFLACCIGSALLTDVFRPFAPREKVDFRFHAVMPVEQTGVTVERDAAAAHGVELLAQSILFMGNGKGEQPRHVFCMYVMNGLHAEIWEHERSSAADNSVATHQPVAPRIDNRPAGTRYLPRHDDGRGESAFFPFRSQILLRGVFLPSVLAQGFFRRVIGVEGQHLGTSFRPA